jgi:hypothetical protein
MWGCRMSIIVACWLQVEASCKHRCLEDLTSTTRFVTWSLHTKTHKALKSMMGKLQAADPTRLGAAGSGSSSNKSGHQQGHENSNGAAGVMIDMLESTLWQRQLGSLPEETVGALVAQVHREWSQGFALRKGAGMGWAVCKTSMGASDGSTTIATWQSCPGILLCWLSCVLCPATDL